MRKLGFATLALALANAASAQPAPASPLAAQLVSAQSELATSPQAGRDHLLAALAAAEGHSDVNVTAYRAAMALGAWALGQQQYAVAHTAWAAALSHAVGASPAAVLARNRARMGEAVTQIAQYAHAPSATARDQAYESLQQSAGELYPYALQEGASADVGLFQAAFAEAIGWRDYGRAANTPRPIAPLHDLTGPVVCPATWHGNRSTSGRSAPTPRVRPTGCVPGSSTTPARCRSRPARLSRSVTRYSRSRSQRAVGLVEAAHRCEDL